MGREGHETTVVCSSIAMLQERFRQLERVKEMREERELLRINLSEPNNDNKQFNSTLKPETNYEPSRLFFHPDLIFPERSTSREVSLSLWPTFEETRFDQDDQYGYRGSTLETPQLFFKLWRLEASILPSSKLGFDDSHESDVDTSLHL